MSKIIKKTIYTTTNNNYSGTKLENSFKTVTNSHEEFEEELYDARSSSIGGTTPVGVAPGKVIHNDLFEELHWNDAKFVASPPPGPYCADHKEGISGDNGVTNIFGQYPLGSQNLPFCSGTTYLSPGEWTEHVLTFGYYPNYTYSTEPGWKGGYEMWAHKPSNIGGHLGFFGAYKEHLGIWEESNGVRFDTSYRPCFNGNAAPYTSGWHVPPLEDSYCVKNSAYSNYPNGNFLWLGPMWFTAPWSNLSAPFYNYDESVWRLMGMSDPSLPSWSGNTFYTLNRILQEYSSMYGVHREPRVVQQMGGFTDFKYTRVFNNFRTTPINEFHTSINVRDANNYPTGFRSHLFMPPLNDDNALPSVLSGKLNPGEHCISYACHEDNVFTTDTISDLRQPGCHSHSPFSNNPWNNYYSWISLDRIVVRDGSVSVDNPNAWVETPKWSFSNATGWTGNVPANWAQAQESAIGTMMFLGDIAWDPNMGPVEKVDGLGNVLSSLYGGPIGMCWLPANQYDLPGTGHWVSNEYPNGDCPPSFAVNSNQLGYLPDYYYGSDGYGPGYHWSFYTYEWIEVNATPSNIDDIDRTQWKRKPQVNAYYKGIRPHYSFLDVAQHLQSMKEHMPLSYEWEEYDWSNRPCGHPTGNPPGCTGAGCKLSPAIPNVTNPIGYTPPANWCGGHEPNGLPRSVNPYSMSGNSMGWNWGQGGGTCCSQSYMETQQYRNAAFSDDPNQDGNQAGTYAGIYNGYNCCDKRWRDVAIPAPKLETGNCDGCNVGCCVDEYNGINMCTHSLINGLWREIFDCEAAHQWENQVLQSPNDVNVGHEKPQASNYGEDSFCTKQIPFIDGCLDPLAWNYNPSANADCSGSAAYRLTTAGRPWYGTSGSILDSNVDDSCCDWEELGWECDLSGPGCTQSCMMNMGGNGLTPNPNECFETQAKCEQETICAPGYSCDNSIPNCSQNCTASRIWSPIQNTWIESSDSSSSNGFRPCFETMSLCNNNTSMGPGYCDGSTWDCNPQGFCQEILGNTGQYLTEQDCLINCTYTGPCYNELNKCNGSIVNTVVNMNGQMIWDRNGSSVWLHFLHSAQVPQLLDMPNNGIGQDIQVHFGGNTYQRTIVDVVDGGNWKPKEVSPGSTSMLPLCVPCSGDIGGGCWNYYLELNQSLPINTNCTTSNQLGVNNQHPSWAAGNYNTSFMTVGWNVI